MTKEKHSFLLIAIFAILTLQTTAQNVFNVPQYHPCSGEEVTMSCYIDNLGFDSLVYVSFNGSQPFSPTEINDGATPGFYLSELKVEKINTSPFQNAITINITFYGEEDSYILFGCHGKFLINNSMSGALASGQLLSQASPPEGLGYLVSSQDSFNTYTCRLRTEFDITEPQSERPILYYNLYSNGDDVSYLYEKSNGYFVGTVQLEPGTSNELQVSSVSCGGESVLSHPITESIRGYTLGRYGFYFFLNSDNMLVLYWSLTKLGEGTNEVNIEYSLQILLNYTTDTVTQNTLKQTTIINVISSERSYTHDLGLSEIGDGIISFDITASLEIVSQCSFEVTDGVVVTDTRNNLNSTVNLVHFFTSYVQRDLLIVVSLLFVICIFICACQSLCIVILYSENSKRRRYAPNPTTVSVNNNAELAAPLLPMPTGVVNPVQVQATTWNH